MKRQPITKGQKLSENERQIFTSLGKGDTTREIAKKRGINLKTVQGYCQRLERKLGAKNFRQVYHMATGAANRPFPDGLEILLDRTDAIEIRFLDARGKLIHARKYRAD